MKLGIGTGGGRSGDPVRRRTGGKRNNKGKKDGGGISEMPDEHSGTRRSISSVVMVFVKARFSQDVYCVER